MAQAMGDFEALSSRGSRVLRFHLKRPSEKSLKNLNARIAGAARRREDDAGAASAVKEVISLTQKKLEERNMIKSPVRKTTAKTKPGAATNEYVLVDHPRNLENITSRHYTIRVSANDARASVDVSINDGPWQACRHAVGYWWYDWAGFTPGTHQIVARTRTTGGEYLISKRRRCKVI